MKKSIAELSVKILLETGRNETLLPFSDAEKPKHEKQILKPGYQNLKFDDGITSVIVKSDLWFFIDQYGHKKKIT